MSNNFVYTEQIVFNNDSFQQSNINPHALFKVFTHMATKHAELLGVGFNDMLKQNLLWVTMRVKYQIVGQLTPNTTYNISTFPQAKNMLEFDRDFLITDINGNVAVKATSKWCVIDCTTRRLSRLQNIDVPCADMQPVFEGKFLKTETFQPAGAPDFTYQVLPEDIDSNGHMNNSIYARIVFEALRQNKAKQIQTFQLNFLKEAMLGEKIDVYLQYTPQGVYATGKRCEKDISFSAFLSFANNE